MTKGKSSKDLWLIKNASTFDKVDILWFRRTGGDTLTFCRCVVGWDASWAFRMVTSPSMRRTGEAWWTLVWEFLLVNPVSSRPKTVPEEMKLGEDECGVELEQLAGESLTSSSQVCLFHLTNQIPDRKNFRQNKPLPGLSLARTNPKKEQVVGRQKVNPSDRTIPRQDKF